VLGGEDAAPVRAEVAELLQRQWHELRAAGLAALAEERHARHEAQAPGLLGDLVVRGAHEIVVGAMVVDRLAHRRVGGAADAPL